MAAIEPTASGVTLRLRVQPKASRNAWRQESSGAVSVYLTAPPIDGEANKALLAFLAKQLRMPRSAFTLLQGARSREKVVRIEGVSVLALSNLLSSTR